MSQEVSNHESPDVGCQEQSGVGVEFDHLLASEKQEPRCSRDRNRDQSYERLDALDHLQRDSRFILAYHEPLIENRDGGYMGFDARHQLRRDPRLSASHGPLTETRDGGYRLHEDYLYPRLISIPESDRGRDIIWRKSSAHYYEEQVGSNRETDYKCRDCGSRGCMRGSQCSRLRQDVYRYNCSRLDDVRFNDFQSDVGRLECRGRYRSGDSFRSSEDYQQLSSDLDCSTDIFIPRPKRIGLCQKFIKGQCWRGASCWYVHDVAGRYHRDKSRYMLAENSLAKDGKPRHKRFIRGDDNADYLYKKRRTESTWRHEDSDYSEDGSKTKGKVSGCGYKQDSSEVRRGYEPITEDSSVCKASDQTLDTAENNDIGREESSYCSESSDSRSERSDVNFNGGGRSREMSYDSDKQLSVKHSRKHSFHQGTPPRKRNSSAIMKHYNFKRKSSYYPNHKHLHRRNDGSVLCKYFMKGNCHRGNRCWYAHDIESSKSQVDLNEKKRSVTKHTSIATNEIPPGHDLSSTNNSKRSSHKKGQSSVGADKSRRVKSSSMHGNTITRYTETFSKKKCMTETGKDLSPNKGKKVSCSQEGAPHVDFTDSSEIFTGNKIAPKHDMQKECVDGEKMTCDDQEGNDNGGFEKDSVGYPEVQKSSVQQIVVRKKLVPEPFSSNLQNSVSEIPSVNLDSCVKVRQPEATLKGQCVAEQAKLPSAIPKEHIHLVSKSDRRSATCNSSNKPCPPCHHLEDVNGVDKDGVNLHLQSLSSGHKVDAAQKAKVSNGVGECLHFQTITSDKPVETPLGHLSELQASGASMGEPEKWFNCDQPMSYFIHKKPSLCQTTTCGNQETAGDGGQMNNRSFTSSRVNHCEETVASNRQVGAEMHARETFTFTPNANSAVSLQMAATEEALLDDIGLDMSLDHYIYNNLSLEHYVSHTEDDNIATARHCTYKEHSSIVENTSVDTTSENLFQHRSVYSLLPACDGISETKPTGSTSTFCSGLPPWRIKFKELEETIREPCFEPHESLTSYELVERAAVKPQQTNARSRFSEDSSLNKKNVTPAIETSDVGCKVIEGNNDEDKNLLRLAVLELAKEILGPIWRAGRLKSKEIYKSIIRKVVDKVCASVQGVNIPRTKENVDRYLLHHKPKIAQLVLEYVNMHPMPAVTKVV